MTHGFSLFSVPFDVTVFWKATNRTVLFFFLNSFVNAICFFICLVSHRGKANNALSTSTQMMCINLIQSGWSLTIDTHTGSLYSSFSFEYPPGPIYRGIYIFSPFFWLTRSVPSRHLRPCSFFLFFFFCLFFYILKKNPAVPFWMPFALLYFILFLFFCFFFYLFLIMKIRPRSWFVPLIFCERWTPNFWVEFISHNTHSGHPVYWHI